MTAEDLRIRLGAEGLDPGAWSNAPGDRYGAHEHAYDKIIVVAAGSIRFGLPAAGGATVALSRGDRMELPADTLHDAAVGPEGVTCLEAHVPRGTLAGGARRIGSGEW